MPASSASAAAAVTATGPAYDDLIQATSGFASLFSRSGGPPRYVPMNIVDRLTGVTAVHAILAALFYRERTGQGQALEIPMFENLIEFMLGDHMSGHLFDPPLAPMGNVRALSANRRPYPTSDGAICVLPGIDKHWKSFFEVAGLEAQYGSDPRFSTASRAREEYRGRARSCWRRRWRRRRQLNGLISLTKADIPCGPVVALEDLYDDPHLQEVSFFSEHDHPTEGRMKSRVLPCGCQKRRPSRRPRPSLAPIPAPPCRLRLQRRGDRSAARRRRGAGRGEGLT